ncbi:MAG: hypothetical protein WDO17_19190 [Alphaproteobacteria bacterium]
MRVAILAAWLLIPSIAQAQHQTKTALSGKPLKLNFSNTTNPDCSSVGETLVRLTQAPQHGKITISKASDFPSFPKGNARRDCNKKRVAGTQTVYVSEPGYTGTDSAAIEIIFPTGGTARRSFAITVK